MLFVKGFYGVMVELENSTNLKSEKEMPYAGNVKEEGLLNACSSSDGLSLDRERLETILENIPLAVGKASAWQ